MAATGSRQIVIAGAGIAGLTAALAFARKGFSVRVYEQAPELQEAGAGLQLSPNATRLLARLGVMEHLMATAVAPERLDLRSARRQTLLAHIPLGEAAERRWKAPYLVAHRADLQAALLAATRSQPAIEITTGARVTSAALQNRRTAVSIDRNDRIEETSCLLLLGADGVHSRLRGPSSGSVSEQPSGYVAWRTTIRRDSELGLALSGSAPADAVTVFLHRRFHLVCYPVRAAAAINLVALTPANRAAPSGGQGHARLVEAMRGMHGPLEKLADKAAPWTEWPISEVDDSVSWSGVGGAILIGDAAHAMTPFAAQGAAMAIEDATALAEIVAARPNEIASALTVYESLRRPRVRRVAARGRFNRRVWHASGLVAVGRDLAMKARRDSLAADLDWLYGYDAQAEALRALAALERAGL